MIPAPVDEPEVLRPGESPRPRAAPEYQSRSPLLLRATLALLLAGASLLAFGVGGVLILTVVGAGIGVPVLLLGCALLLIAFFTLAGGGRWAVRRF